MTEGITIDIDVPDIDALRDRVVKAVQQEMSVHAMRMEMHAKTAVPHRTGRLQQSITTKVSKGANTTTITMGANARSEGKDGTGEMYGPFVEYGTGQRGMAGGATYKGVTNSDVTYNAAWPGMDARPFLRPALYDLQETLKTGLDDAVRRALE